VEQGAPAAAAEDRRLWQARLARLLGHPLLILLVGALISALVVPMLTRRWQDHQRALDVQTTLVSDMTESAERFAQAIRVDQPFLQTPTTQPTFREALKDLNAAERAWSVRWAVIESRLGAYYRGTRIPSDWGRLAGALEALYQGSLGGALAIVSDAPLAKVLGTSVKLEDQDGFNVAQRRVEAYRDAIVRRVLDTSPRI
jgi:hypothetical protein